MHLAEQEPEHGPARFPVIEVHRAPSRRAVEAGGTFAMGTDSGVTPHDRLGSVEPGRIADLVVMTGDLFDFSDLGSRVAGVWKGGARVVPFA
jgi:imidazolonepropionase-like amidohydrolase